MLRIRIITIKGSRHYVVEIDDSAANCCSKVIEQLAQTRLPGNMLICVEFSPGTKPSVAAIVVGWLSKKYETVAISEKDWDSFIVAASCNDIFPIGSEIC